MVERHRHGCLSALLWMMALANTALACTYALAAVGVGRLPVILPAWLFGVLSMIAVFNVACVLALLRWRQWGFWGYCAACVIVLCLDATIGVGPLRALMGLLGVPVLYGVLHLGVANQGWAQLE